MLDGELFLHDQDLIGKMSGLLAQLRIDRQLMRARFILQIDAEQSDIARSTGGGIREQRHGAAQELPFDAGGFLRSGTVTTTTCPCLPLN